MNLDWLKRKLPFPAQDRFAEQVIDELVRSGVERSAFTYDAEGFRIRRGDDVFNLVNLYNFSRQKWPWQRRQEIRRFVERFQRPTPERPGFEEARSSILPNLRDAFMLETMRLQAAIDGRNALPVPLRRLSSRLTLLLYFDMPDQMSLLTEADLASWGVEWDDLLRIAMENLEARTATPLKAVTPGVYASAWSDCYDTARLLLPSVLGQLEIAGDPVAFAPCWNHLVVTGDGDPGLLGAAMRWAEKVASQDPRPMSMLPIVRRGTTWCDLELPIGHPCHETLKELRVKELAWLYGEQKQLLEKLNGASGGETFTASYQATQREGDGAFSSYCVWSNGIEQTLPEAETVVFFDDDQPEGKKILATLDWRAVQRQFGHLLEPTGDLPARHLTKGFPDPAALRGNQGELPS
jgi:hypothetical protein